MVHPVYIEMWYTLYSVYIEIEGGYIKSEIRPLPYIYDAGWFKRYNKTGYNVYLGIQLYFLFFYLSKIVSDIYITPYFLGPCTYFVQN